MDSKQQAEQILEDEFADEALLLVRKSFTPTGYTYTYGALKMNGLWHVTGKNAPREMTTHEFITWLCQGRDPFVQLFWAKTVHEI